VGEPAGLTDAVPAGDEPDSVVAHEAAHRVPVVERGLDGDGNGDGSGEPSRAPA
jgi:hypothetical protein